MRPISIFAIGLLVTASCSSGASDAQPTVVETAGNSEANDATPPELAPSPVAALAVESDLTVAQQRAKRSGKPLLVLSVLGDWTRHC